MNNFLQHRIQHVLPESAPNVGWQEILRLQNVEWVSKRIIEFHKVPRKQFQNVQKQANQIRYCILQAKEYFEAAKNASMATRPLQMYYCCMSLAQAEILLKGDGNSSLERLREKHSNHGLDFKFDPSSLRDKNYSGIKARAS